jgi:hypothetical protein
VYLVCYACGMVFGGRLGVKIEYGIRGLLEAGSGLWMLRAVYS